MPRSILSADDFRAAAREGDSPEGMVYRLATSDPQTVGGVDERTERFLFSEGSVDLAGDAIAPKGWKLDSFKKNPVALFSHTSWDPPIGKASNVAIQGNKLVGDITFADADTYPFADTIYRLVRGGFLKAVSVGFKPTKWTFTNDKERPYGIDFLEQILLEISVCCVPCNPQALLEARSVGIDTAPLVGWAEKVLDNGDTVFLPRAELEGLRTQAKGSEPRQYYIQGGSEYAADVAERVRETVKAWQQDQTSTLILPEGFNLREVSPASDRTVVDKLILEFDLSAATVEAKLATLKQAADKLGVLGADLEGLLTGDALIDTTDKAGRRVSAATKAKLQGMKDAAIAHCEAVSKQFDDLMGDDGPDAEDDPAVEKTADPAPTPEPDPEVDPDKDLSPEDRRLKEARALRASLNLTDD